MKKGKLFFVIIVWGILGVATASWAQRGYQFERQREAEYSDEADSSAVRVYGPDVLTELARQAIQEERPHVAVETYYKPLKNKVWIEGTTGSDYMPLSPRRVALMKTARAKGGSVYSALCSQQKEVIQQTVGIDDGWRRVDAEEYRTETRVCYVRPIFPPPPPPAIFVPPIAGGLVIGGPYSLYGYRAYGGWGDRHYPYHKEGRGFGSSHKGYGGRRR